MERERLAQIIADAPVWARLALTSAKPELVERAADAMAALILHRMEDAGAPDSRQLGLVF